MPGYSQPSLRDKEVPPIATQASPFDANGQPPDIDFSKSVIYALDKNLICYRPILRFCLPVAKKWQKYL